MNGFRHVPFRLTDLASSTALFRPNGGLYPTTTATTTERQKDQDDDEGTLDSRSVDSSDASLSSNHKDNDKHIVTTTTVLPVEHVPTEPVVAVHESSSSPMMSSEDALELLIVLYQDSDPLATLNEYYQKQGVPRIKPHFLEQNRSKRPNDPPSWQCTFSCPLTGTDYHSTLPRTLLLVQKNRKEHDVTTTPQELELETMTKGLLGEYTIVTDNNNNNHQAVLFSTKKGAKRSAGLVALNAIQRNKVAPPPNEFKDEQAVVSEKERTTTLAHNSRDPPHGRRRFYYPNYIRHLYHRLCDWNIDSSSVNISFREHVSPTWNSNTQRSSGLSRSDPTLLSCLLSVASPMHLSIVGPPRSSKKHALQGALTLLGEEVAAALLHQQRRHPERTSSNVAHHQSSRRTSSPEDKRTDLEHLANCDGKSAIYIYPLSTWATTSISLHKRVYLYELEFLCLSGEPLVSSRMGLERAFTTPIGILFAEDVCTYHPTNSSNGANVPGKSDIFRTRFEYPLKGGATETMTVLLKHRTVLVPPSAAPHKEDDPSLQLRRIQKFNQHIFSWKTYGFGLGGTAKGNTTDFETLENPSPLDRTYLFVPLHCDSPGFSSESRTNNHVAIDWELLRNVANGTPTPLLTFLDDKWSVPFLGSIDFWFIKYTSILLALAVFAPFISISVRTEWSEPFVPAISSEETVLGLLFAIVSIVAFSCERYLAPNRPIPAGMLQNRFLTQKKPTPSALYVLDQNDRAERIALTALSQLNTAEDIELLTDGQIDHNTKTFGLDMRRATFREYYNKKYGIVLRKPKERLLSVQVVQKHSEHCLLSERGVARDKPIYIVPELVLVLPMPRDVLYMFRHANLFMPAIERIIEVERFGHRMHQLAHHIHSGVQHSSERYLNPPKTLSSNYVNPITTRSLSSLIIEATTLTPCKTYERLEFFGDAVLGFFLAINVMARNSKLEFDEEDINEIYGDAVKNKILINACLQIGLNRIIDQGKRNWQSAHRRNNQNDKNPPSENNASPLEHHDDHHHHSATISDKVLADVVESLLAVAYIEGRRSDYDHTGGCMVIGMLEELQLPKPKADEDKGINDSYGWHSFPSGAGQHNPCLSQGYSFEVDKTWEQQLVQLGTILNCEQHETTTSRLHRGRTGLIQILQSSLVAANNESSALLEKFESSQTPSILLLCALFDDNLEPDDALSIKSSASLTTCSRTLDDSFAAVDVSNHKHTFSEATIETGLIRVAVFRDTLYFVGHHALQLYVTQEIYQRYPSATAGDLHMLRACSTNDDVVVYVFVKAGVHKCLYDQEENGDARSAQQFGLNMIMADSIGTDIWKKREGWILPGGAVEFQRRTAASNTRQQPQYVGLAGGRLYGHEKKVPEEITENLMYSFKAIMGAFVLSFGLDTTISYLLEPLFEELLLLSPKEMRSEYSGTSMIVQNYKKGHESHKAGGFRE